MNTNDVCKPLSLTSAPCFSPLGQRPKGSGVDLKVGRAGESPLHSLTKSELAQLYFPGAPRSSALRLLHKYITTAHGLLPALEQVGYTRTSRRLTRRQVQLIFEYLGEP